MRWIHYTAGLRWLFLAWAGCLWPAGASLLGQQANRFAFRVQPTEEAVYYTVQFTTDFRYGNEKISQAKDPGHRSGPIDVRLWLSDYTVTGPDTSVANMVSVRINLPESIPGETVFLSSLMREGGTPAFQATVGEQIQETGSVTVSYAGREVTRTIVDFVHTVRQPAALPPPVAIEVTHPAARPSATSATGQNEPAEGEPPYQVDYRRLSPEAFIEEWPDQEDLVNSALGRIPLRAQVEEIATNVFELRLPYVRAAVIDSVTGGNRYTVRADEVVPLYGHRFVVEVADTGVYRLHLSDSTKHRGTTVVTLDNLLAGTFEQSTDSAAFTFRGGRPPYMLLFLRNGTPITDHDVGSDTVWQTDLGSLRQLIGTAGKYGMQLTDSQRSVTWNFGGAELEIARLERPIQDYRIPLAILAALLLLGIVYWARKHRQRERGKQIRENLRSGDPSLEGSVPVISAPAVSSSAYASRPRDKRQAATVPVGFRVTKRDVRDRFNGLFNPDETPTQFLSLELSELWSASRVSEVLFGKVAIGTLDSFLRKGNIDKIVAAGRNEAGESWERNEDIPEIGGMLMGQYQLEANGLSYRVSVEQFIPLAARVQNLVKMEIDPMSLARDLSTAQDDYPHLTVVGWFHTHPGHGLFLSQPDLKVQYNHFRKPYHFAMEIDSLTDQLDTAFFTYMPNDRMNNRDTRRNDRGWFSWGEIEKFSRHQTNTLL